MHRPPSLRCFSKQSVISLYGHSNISGLDRHPSHTPKRVCQLLQGAAHYSMVLFFLPDSGFLSQAPATIWLRALPGCGSTVG